MRTAVINPVRPSLKGRAAPRYRVLFCLLIVQLLVAAGDRAADEQVLLSHGSSDTFWYGLLRTDAGGPVTQVWVRSVDTSRSQQSAAWQPLPEIPGRTVQLADYHGELLVILDDGQWKRVSPAQFASGPPLPARGPILAMAGGRDALWAISRGAPPRTPASAPVKNTATLPTSVRAGLPATVPAPSAATTASGTPSTGPATQPARLQLYQLDGGTWLWHGELPQAFQTITPPLLSMAVVGSDLLLAATEEDGRVQIHRYDSPNRGWEAGARIAPGLKPARIKLMAIRDRAVLWAKPAEGAGTLVFRPQPAEWSAAKPIALPPALKFTALVVAAAGDEVRVLGLQGADKIFEQKYGVGGEITQPMTEMGAAKVTVERPGWMQMVLLLALGSFVLTNLSRRKPTQVIEIAKVRIALAPLGLRLVAGLIDATPVFVALMWASRYAPKAEGWQQLLHAGSVRWLVLGSWAVYVIHTLVAELIWARSLGKMCLGLRVVGFDGQKAPARAIVTRNVLRLFDVILGGISLTSVFFSPLRQRLGDIPAATLVAVAMPTETLKKVEEN